MAAINPSILVRDLDVSDGSVADQTVTNVTDMSVTFKLGALEDISYGVQGDGIPILRPGTRTGPRRLDLSFDGVSYDARMFSYAPTVNYDEPITLSETGVGSADVLNVTAVNRQTAQQIKLSDALYGAKGSVTTSSGNIPLPSSTLPNFEGIGRTKLGFGSTPTIAGLIDTFYRYVFKVDDAVKNKVLDIDVNRDYVLRSLQEILARLPAATDPEHTQFVTDSSDNGVLGGAQTIAIGFKGSTPYLTFDGVDVGLPACPVLRGTTYAPSYSSLYARTDFVGGDTHHGAPDGGRITSLVTVGTANGLGTTQDTCVVGFSNPNGTGGCYVWQASGRLLLLSQAFSVNHQWFDPGENKIYAATDVGIYRRTADLTVAADYGRLGSKSLRCIKVLVDISVAYSPDTAAIYALASGNQPGQNGIMRYDGSGPLGGWTLIQPNEHVTDFCAWNGVVYYLASDNLTHLIRFDYMGTGATTYLPIASGTYSGIGLDPLVLAGSLDGIALRTSGGGSGLYLVDSGGTSLTALAGIAAGVAVNQITKHNPNGSSTMINDTVPCDLLAATSSGVWYWDGAWHQADGQSNLADLNILFVADDDSFSPDGTLNCWPVYAANDSQFYVSYDGMLHFVEVFAQQLTAGPAFYDLWEAAHPGNWPAVTDTALSYGGYSIVRAMNGLNHWYYTDTNADSISAGGAQRNAELAQISTPSQVPEGIVSRQLLDADDRFLAIAADPQTICEVESFYEDTSNALHTLRPGHQVTLHAKMQQVGPGIGTQVFVDVNTPMYVLEHTLTFSAAEIGTVRTKTRLGTRLLSDAQDPAQAQADSLYALSRTQQYRTKGRH